MTSYGNEHFEDGEVYLDGLTDPQVHRHRRLSRCPELLY